MDRLDRIPLTRVKRRTFLAGLGGVPATALVSHLSVEVSPLLSDLAGAKRLGALYITQTPAEADPEVLTALLGIGNIQKTVNDALVRRHMSHQIKLDFALGRTVALGGWLLSRTEARACALTLLLD